MSDFATFTLCGTVMNEPQPLSNFATGRTYDAMRFAVKVCKPARDGGQTTAETVEIDAWGNVQQQLCGAHAGCAVLVHGALCARTTQQGRSFLSLRASAVRVLGGNAAPDHFRGATQKVDAASAGTPPGSAPHIGEEDIPF